MTQLPPQPRRLLAGLTSGTRLRDPLLEVPKGTETGNHNRARERLMVAVSLGLAAIHLTLLAFELAAGRAALTVVAYSVAAATDLVAPLVLLSTRSIRSTGAVLVLGLCVVVVLGGLAGGGHRSASLPISLGIPLLATFVGGRRLGILSALIFILHYTLLFTFARELHAPDVGNTQDPTGATTLGLIVTLCLITALGWALEGERADTHRALERSERRFRLLGEHTADIVFVHDEAGVLVAVNEQASSVLGQSRAALLGGGLSAFENADEHLAAVREMTRAGVASFERSYRKSDGSRIPVDVRVSRFDMDGSPMYLASARDVSDRRNAEAALRHAVEASERANRAKSRFLANISHELRTPLNAIIGFARVLSRGTFGPLGPQQSRFTANILEAGEHMLTLVNNLLDYRRMEDGEGSVRLQPLGLHEPLREALTLVRALVDDRHHTLEVEVPDDLPPVIADRQALVRVLSNLLTNACKYTDDGGRIRVEGSASNDMVTVCVRDNGIGIAPEDHERVFNYFEQVENPLAARSHGAGLGLALTRKLVHNLGGGIRLESQLGQGSAFIFTLCRADTSGAALNQPPRSASSMLIP